MVTSDWLFINWSLPNRTLPRLPSFSQWRFHTSCWTSNRKLRCFTFFIKIKWIKFWRSSKNIFDWIIFLQINRSNRTFGIVLSICLIKINLLRRFKVLIWFESISFIKNRFWRGGIFYGRSKALSWFLFFFFILLFFQETI